MCVQSSFYHQLWINTWRSEFEQQTDSILSACGSHGQESQGSWYDRLECTTSCTIPAQCMEKTSRRGILGRPRSCDSERIEILSDSIECNHPSRYTSSFLPKVVRLKTGEVLYEKSYMSPRPPPKISLRHDHDWTRGKVPLGSTVDQQPESKVVR